MGVRLWTRARVKLTDRPGVVRARILNIEGEEDTRLLRLTALRVLRRFRAEKRFGAEVETLSSIPIAAGLKSSSAVSNAVTLATLEALGGSLSDFEILRLSVEASLEAGVTVTGAYDDACASYFGGLVITDNTRMRIVKRSIPKGYFRVLIYVPEVRRYTKDVNVNELKHFRKAVDVAYNEALKGNSWLSLTLNGLAYSLALGYDLQPVREAIRAGALAAGISGKGPAIAAIVPARKVDRVRSAWSSLVGKVIETTLNTKKATATRLES